MKGTFLRLALKNSILFKFIFRKSVISNGLNHLLHLTIAMVTIYTCLLHTQHVLYVIFHVYYTTKQNKKSESQFKVFIREMGSRGGHHLTHLHQKLRMFKLKPKKKFPPNNFSLTLTIKIRHSCPVCLLNFVEQPGWAVVADLDG